MENHICDHVLIPGDQRPELVPFEAELHLCQVRALTEFT